MAHGRERGCGVCKMILYEASLLIYIVGKKKNLDTRSVHCILYVSLLSSHNETISKTRYPHKISIGILMITSTI